MKPPQTIHQRVEIEIHWSWRRALPTIILSVATIAVGLGLGWLLVSFTPAWVALSVVGLLFVIAMLLLAWPER